MATVAVDVGVGGEDVAPAVADLAGVGAFEEVEAAQEGGFAAAGGADDEEGLAGADVGVDAVEHRAGAEAFDEAADLEEGVRHRV